MCLITTIEKVQRSIKHFFLFLHSLPRKPVSSYHPARAKRQERTHERRIKYTGLARQGQAHVGI